MKKILRLLSYLFIVYLAGGALIYLLQDSLLYFPTKKEQNNYKQELFKIQNESIYASVANPEKKKAIIYFGGNAEDVEYNYLRFSMLFKKHSVYLIQYRGYGNSSGRPSEEKLYSDALYIYDKLKKKHKDISVIGRSLGSGIATYVASYRDVEKLILVTPYDTIEKLAQQKLKIYPISLMLKDKYDSISRVDDIKMPTLIIYIKGDTTVYNERTQMLIDKFPKSQVTVKVIENETHNSLLDNTDYYFFMKRFIY